MHARCMSNAREYQQRTRAHTPESADRQERRLLTADMLTRNIQVPSFKPYTPANPEIQSRKPTA
jgi:hypothetical protein